MNPPGTPRAKPICNCQGAASAGNDTAVNTRPARQADRLKNPAALIFTKCRMLGSELGIFFDGKFFADFTVDIIQQGETPQILGPLAGWDRVNGAACVGCRQQEKAIGCRLPSDVIPELVIG